MPRVARPPMSPQPRSGRTAPAPWRVAGVVVAVVTAVVCAAASPSALADVARCSDNKVEYLVGRAAQGGVGSTCASAGGSTPASRPSASRVTGATGLVTGTPTARPAGSGPIMKPDDAGRREILEQELQKERLALADLDRARAPMPGAGSFDEQRNRRLADISALESELRRIPGS